MIEQGIYFALGCIVTALLALLFAPVFWRRALRLTRQRLSLQVPLSMQEILAQRDQLRAEFAVERLRLEQAMQAVQSSKGADMAEIGRWSMEATTLKSELSLLRESDTGQRAEIERRRREAAEASAELGALHMALHHDEGSGDKWRARAQTAIAQSARLQAELDLLQGTVAELKASGVGLEMRLAERSDGDVFKRAETALRGRLEAAVAQAARHEASNISVRRELDEAKSHIRRLEEDLDAARASRGSQGAHSSWSGATEGSAGDPDTAVRETIHALGLAVADLMRERRETQDVSRPAVGNEVARPLGVA